jgi:D-serine deaminase-like pyridoxal phosphate-dependent protein
MDGSRPAFPASTAGSVGMDKGMLDTPALLVDLDVVEANIARMTKIFRDRGINWRPHTKGMKIPALAQKLIDAGAIGVTCAKLGEAEVMAAGGIKDILVANQIVGPQKLARLVAVQHHADVMVVVDSWENVSAIDAAAVAAGVRVRVLIEVDTGMNRAGVQPGEATLAFAKKIAPLKGVKFTGLMTWEAHALSKTDPAEKRKTVEAALAGFVASAELIRAAGIPVEILSCGGTGTYWISAEQPGITEIEAGGGIYSDVVYRQKFGVEHPYAMTVLTTVTSRPVPTRIICDAGRKTLSGDAASPEPLGVGKVKTLFLSAEHAIITLEEPNDAIRIGDKIEMVVGYSDTTVHLHEEMYGIRKGKVEAVWPVLGRGKLR